MLLLAKVKGVISSLSNEILQLEKSGFRISVIIKKEMLKLANEA
jgi:predicted nucleic acid-binding protein